MVEKLLKDLDGDVFRAVWAGDNSDTVPASIVRVIPEGDVPLEGKFWATLLSEATPA